MLLIALTVLVCIGLGGRWILTRDEPISLQDNSAHLAHVGRDNRKIFLSLDLQPLVNGGDDPIRLTKAELLPDAPGADEHWIRVVDVRALSGDLRAAAASGRWPDDAGAAADAPKLKGFTVKPGKRVRLLFVVDLPDLERTDDLSLAMSRTWSRLRVTYEQDGDTEVVEARTSIQICIPHAVACER